MQESGGVDVFEASNRIRRRIVLEVPARIQNIDGRMGPTPTLAEAPIDRRPFTLREELMLAILPTGTMLLVLFVIEAVANQRLLFASLASSAFLIYVDPGHTTNRVRTLLLAHGSAATIGVLVDVLLGTGYGPAAVSMTLTILITLTLRAVHPPAISTALSFAFRPGDADKWAIFIAALAIVSILVVLQPLAARLLARTIRIRRQGGGRRAGS